MLLSCLSVKAVDFIITFLMLKGTILKREKFLSDTFQKASKHIQELF
jgi:hypothetical protein